MTIQINTGKGGKKTYTVRISRGGKAIKKTFKKRAEAQTFEREVLRNDDLLNGLGCNVLNNTTLKDVIKLYWEDYKGKNRQTVAFQLDWWAEQFKTRTVGRIAKRDVAKALRDLEVEKELAPATINRYKAALSGLFTWYCSVYHADQVDYNPARGIRQRREDNARARFLSDDEIKRLFAAVRISNWDRLFLLVLLAVTTGARRGELIGLKWQDIDLRARRAFLSKTKNGSARVLPLTGEVVEEMMKFRGPGAQWVFPHISNPTGNFYLFNKYWKKALIEARISGFKFHDLRHSCASLLAKNGATLKEIAEILGHKSIQMTDRYSHLCTDHKAALTDRVMGKLASGGK